mmetsp:Transcript_1074/g.2084  ORF Transcript_1074/g.2084 Transcript_1074/m.2084 type:complete len:187 (-) Transcript_1074:623-1183(-)
MTKKVKLLSNSDESFLIPIEAARLSEIISAEIDIHLRQDDDDDDDGDIDNGEHGRDNDDGDNNNHHHPCTEADPDENDTTTHDSNNPSSPIRTIDNDIVIVTITDRLSPRILRKITQFLIHHATIEPMTPIEPPFPSEDIRDIVRPATWYADFITVDVDCDFLLEMVRAANFLVSDGLHLWKKRFG